MSFTVKLGSLTGEEKELIRNKCIIVAHETPYSPSQQKILTYKSVTNKTTNGYVLLPLSLWGDFYETFPNKFKEHKLLSDTTFKGELLIENSRNQRAVVREALEKLNKDHTCLLALRTGFGKSIISIYLALQLGLKTAIVCHYNSLHKQWKKYFENVSFLKIQILSKIKLEKIDSSADVYIVGAKKAAKLGYSVFKDVGIVVVDEVESVCTEYFSKSLFNFRPQYLIGCSATPDRPDGLDRLLYNYFGPRSRFIFRKQTKNFTVIKYKTPFNPTIKYDRQGYLNWIEFTKSLSLNSARQRMICNIISAYKPKRILLFVKRIEEMNNIVTLLKGEEYQDSVDFVTAKKKEWDDNCRVLVGTRKKIGVGFDVTNREVTIMGEDMKDVRQPEGRVRLDNNLIIDVVDNHNILEKHWKIREKWYLNRGATIVNKVYNGYAKNS